MDESNTLDFLPVLVVCQSDLLYYSFSASVSVEKMESMMSRALIDISFRIGLVPLCDILSFLITLFIACL